MYCIVQITLYLCSVISALENIAKSVVVQVGQTLEVATMSQFSLSVTATTRSSVQDEGFVLQATLETEITATLPVDLFDKFDSVSTVVQITVSVVTVKELFPSKSGGTVSSSILSLDVGIEVSDLTDPIQICIPADAVSSYHLYSVQTIIIHLIYIYVALITAATGSIRIISCVLLQPAAGKESQCRFWDETADG